MRRAALAVVIVLAAGCGSSDGGRPKTGQGRLGQATLASPLTTAVIGPPVAMTMKAADSIAGHLPRCKDDRVPVTPATRAQDETAVACLVNKVRIKNGLRPLRFNRRLYEAARRHAGDMVRLHYFDRTGRDGSSSLSRIRAAGYLGRRSRDWEVGENLAWGTEDLSTPAAIVQSWLNSPGHRRTILTRSFREQGVALAAGTPNGAGGNAGTYVQEFGTRAQADVTFTAPNEGAVIAPGVTTVTVNATNANGISRCTLFADNVRVSLIRGAGPTFNWNWDASGAADGKHVLRANCVDGAGAGIPGVSRTVKVDSTVRSTANVDSTPLPKWPLDFGAGTFVNWPETHFSTSESGVVSASDLSVPAGAPTNQVTRLVAGNDPLGGGGARSSIQQKYSVAPDNWNATHKHVDATGTITYDPYPAEYQGKDGVEGMERWVREAVAVPAGSQLARGMLVSDWHAYWGVPIALRTAADGSANWELVIRGGKFEYAPTDPVTGVIQYPAWTKALNADGTKKYPYWSPYTLAAEGAPYPHPTWTFAQESQRIFKVAPIAQGQWAQLTWHIVYSSDPAKGRLQLWWNGALVTDYSGPTLYNLINSPRDPAHDPTVNPRAVVLDGSKPVYHQLQAYQPATVPTDPPQRIFVTADNIATSDSQVSGKPWNDARL